MLIEYKNHKIFAFSDTHGLNYRLNIPKDADILICAGDCLREDNMVYVDDEFLRFLNWYSHQEAKLKIYVPGNHEVFFEMNPEKATRMIPSSIVLLEDSGIEFDDISFFGVACRPWMFKGTENKVPKGVDFLITHGPAEGHLDDKTGCQVLKAMIDESKPKHHIFGHIHEEGGNIESTESTTYYNVSMYNQLKYQYSAIRENIDYTNGIIKGIEEDLINSYNNEDRGYWDDKGVLSLRKKLINEMVLSNQWDYIDTIKEFNNSLRDALIEMSDRAIHTYEDLSNKTELGDEIKIKARLYFSKQYSKYHPIQGGDRQDLWNVLIDGSWNNGYASGISTYYLPQGAAGYPFDVFVGSSGRYPKWLDGFEKEFAERINLIDQFHHLYNHTEFALTDFIYVRDFYSVINVVIKKGGQDEE